MIPTVVTGASGFLGRALIARLEKLGTPCTAVSRQALPGMVRVIDYAGSPAADIIVHLAEEPDRARVNHLGQAYVDQAASVVRQLSSKAGHFVYISSGVVYGDDSAQPCRVDGPVHATDLYSVSKIRNERIALDAGATVLRLSNLYGTGMSPNNVLSDIAKQIPGSGPLRVRDASPVRDFLSVDEAALALAFATRARLPGIFNVGSGVGLSIREVATIALTVANESSRAIESTRTSAHRSINVLDISDTQARLDWCPATPSRRLEQFFSNGANLDH